jgi:hypothetical protein
MIRRNIWSRQSAITSLKPAKRLGAVGPAEYHDAIARFDPRCSIGSGYHGALGTVDGDDEERRPHLVLDLVHRASCECTACLGNHEFQFQTQTVWSCSITPARPPRCMVFAAAGYRIISAARSAPICAGSTTSLAPAHSSLVTVDGDSPRAMIILICSDCAR